MAEPVIMQSTGLERVRQSLVTEQQQRNAQGLSNLAWVKSSHFPGYSAWKDPLEKGKATHSSILSCKIPWTVESMGSQRAKHN